MEYTSLTPLRCVLIAVAASTLIGVGSAFAQSVQVSLPAQALSQSLKDLARQSGANILFTPDSVAGIRAPELHGQLTVADAVAKLLAATDLEAAPDGNGGLIVRRKVIVPRKTERPPPPVAALEEVIITGSRIPEAPGQGVQPVRSYSRQDIERSGETTLSDFLRRLPDVSVSTNEAFSTGSTSFIGQTTVQLHGLPVGTTLVLLNGRRTESNSDGFFDLGNIPPSAIQRVEVLPVGASAVYGSDALGGAVNIVLRSDIDGFEANGKFGHAAGLNDSDATFAWGTRWKRGSVSIIGTYQDRGELMGTQREVTSTTTFPGPAQPSWVWDICSPGTVYSLDGNSLPGLSSPVAGIPRNVTGTVTVAQFAATAGKVNLCNAYQYEAVIPRTQREGLLISAHQQVNESMDLFSELLLTHNDTRLTFGSLLNGFGGSFGATTVDAANPYNPFGQTVGISFAAPNALKDTLTYPATFVRPLVGIRGALFTDWHYEATASLSRDQFRNDFPNLNFGALQSSLNSPNPATAFNPFTSGAPGSPQVLQSLLGTPSLASEVNRRVGGQALIRGPVAQLPGGPLQAVVGTEYSRETLVENIAGSTNLDLERVDYSAFTEARVPLLAGSMQIAGDDLLTLTLAGRYDHSSDYGGKATWQTGLAWRPTSTLLLRGGYGISYKAPLLSQLGAGLLFSAVGDNGFVDPFRGGQPVGSSEISSSSNPNLKPEAGDSTTLGLVYANGTQVGFEASLSYFSIHVSNYIFIPSFQALIDNPSAFPGAVTRSAPTAQDLQNGYLGQITRVDDTYFNFGDLRVKGFDADVKYTFNTTLGELSPAVALANIFRWDAAITPGSPTASYVSQATVVGPGFAPRWKGTASLDWRRGPLSVSFAGRYLGRYKDYQDIQVNSNELGNFWIFDLNSRYQVGNKFSKGADWSHGTYVALGVVNLLDRQPQLSYFVPYDVAQADIRGRFVYAQVGVKW